MTGATRSDKVPQSQDLAKCAAVALDAFTTLRDLLEKMSARAAVLAQKRDGER